MSASAPADTVVTSGDIAVFAASGAALAIVVAAESAIRNHRRNRLERLVRDEARLARLDKALERDRDLLDSLLIVRLTATTVLTLGIADYVTGRSLTEHLGGLLTSLGLVLLAIIVAIYGVVRSAVRRAPERALLVLFPVVRALDFLLTPVRWLLSRLSRLLSRLFGVSDAPESEETEFREEIFDAVSGGERDGVIEEDEREMIENVVDFKDQAVSQVMTPRTRIHSIPVDLAFGDAVRAAVESGHSRIPVHEKSVDHIVGVLFVKDLVQFAGAGATKPPTLRGLIRQAPFVPETKKIADLLQEFRRGVIHMAIVLDEYGGTAGLVTLEDLVEEIVGEIRDELDHEEANAPDPIVRRGDREADVSALLKLDELNEALNVALPKDEAYETVGGFLFSRMGRIPEAGEEFAHENVTFRILDADARQINRVKVSVGS